MVFRCDLRHISVIWWRGMWLFVALAARGAVWSATCPLTRSCGCAKVVASSAAHRHGRRCLWKRIGQEGLNMAISLAKGGNVSLTKTAADAGNPQLTVLTVGLGWDARTTTGTEFDLDASAIAVGEGDKVVSDGHFVFFNN